MAKRIDENGSFIASGAGGGKSGGSSSPTEAPNSLKAKSVARILEIIAEGPIKGLVDGDKSLFFNKVPYANADGGLNFDGISYAFLNGSPDQEALEGFTDITTTISVSTEVDRSTSVIRRITNPDVDTTVVTVSVPNLTKLDSKTGDLNGSRVDVAVYVKSDADASGSVYVRKVRDIIQGKTTSTYERAYRIPLEGEGPWDIKMERITADSSSSTLQNSTFFTRYSEIISHKIAYQDSVILATEVDAELFGSSPPSRAVEIYGLLVNYPSNYDPDTRTYTGLWDGTFTFGYCNNPAWVLWDMLTSRKHGARLPAAYIDKWGFYEVAQYSDELVSDGLGGTEPRFTFNGTVQTREDAYKVIQSIASMMRSAAYFSTGLIRLSQDKPAAPEKLFNQTNVIGDFNYSGTARAARHTVAQVQWVNPEIDYESDIEVVENRAAILKYGYRALDLTAFGTTSRGQAHRQGRYVLATEELESEIVQFKVGQDSADLLPGDVILVSDPSQSTAEVGGRNIGATLTTLSLDRHIVVAPTKNCFITFHLADGTPHVSAITSDNESTNIVTLVTPIPDADLLPDALSSIWVMYNDDIEPKPFRIMDIEEEEPNEYKIVASQYAEEKFNIVDNFLDIEAGDNSYSSLANPTAIGAVTGLDLSFRSRLQDGRVRMYAELDWVQPDAEQVRGYVVSYQYENNNWIQLPEVQTTNIELTDIIAGEYRFVVRAVNMFGIMSPRTAIDGNFGNADASTQAPISNLLSELGNTLFEGADCTVSWNSESIVSDATDVTDGKDPFFKHFLIDVYNAEGTKLLRSETTKDTHFNYTYAMNEADNGSAVRSFQIRVAFVDVNDNTSTYLSQTFANPQANNPTVTAEGQNGRVTLTYPRPLHPDFSGLRVHASTSQDFTVNEGSIVYEGSGDPSWPAPSGTPVYYRYAAYDSFGKDGLVYSAEGVVTTTAVSLDDMPVEFSIIEGEIAAAQAQLDDLEEAYGDSQSAAASTAAAEAARDASETARDNSQLAQTITEAARDQASDILDDVEIAEGATYTARDAAQLSEAATAAAEVAAVAAKNQADTILGNVQALETSAAAAEAAAEAFSNSSSTSAGASETSRIAADAVQTDLEASDKYTELHRVTSSTDRWVPPADGTHTHQIIGDVIQFTSTLGTTQSNSAAGNTGGVYYELPTDIETEITGEDIQIVFSFEAPSSNASTNVGVAYSTHSVGNTAWRVHPISATGITEIALDYAVGSTNTILGDFIGIIGDADGLGNSVNLHSVKLYVKGSYLDVGARLAATAAATAEEGTFAAASADESEQFSIAATTAKLAAETAQAAATVSETNATQSETNAEGSAATSASEATNSANSATNAGQSATAAASSASTAASEATDASQSATAADTAKLEAETAQAAAAISATNAAGSETNAEGSAATSASEATNSANSATNSGNSASASATSASIAATEATDASQSATAADTAKLEAETAQAAAVVARDDAAVSETNAAGSASSALVSEGISVTAALDSLYEAIQLFPSTFENGDNYWTNTLSGLAGTQAGVSDTDDMSLIPDLDKGTVLEIGATNSNKHVAPKGRLRPYVGQVFRLEWDAKYVGTDQPASPRVFSTQVRTVDADGSSFGSNTVGPTKEFTAVNTWETFYADIAISSSTASAPFVFPFIFTNSNHKETGDTILVSRFTISDVTSEVAASTGAAAAAISATNAAASATAAGQSASSSQTFANNASTSAGQATTSAGQAAASETNADSAQAAAATSATNAATSENNAGQSATAAASSASTAASEATDAAQSASASETSQLAAGTSQAAANISQGAAATSETNAAGSATSAALDASLAVSAKNDAATNSALNSGDMSLGGVYTRHILHGTTYSFATIAADNKVYVNDVLNTTLQPSTTTNIELSSGDVIETDSPCAIVSTSGEVAPSSVHAGTKFVSYSNRSNHDRRITVKALSDCAVDFFHYNLTDSSGQQDVSGAPSFSIALVAGQIYDSVVDFSDGNDDLVSRIKSSGPIIVRVSSNGNGSDRELLLPAKPRAILARGGSANTYAFDYNDTIELYASDGAGNLTSTTYAPSGVYNAAIGDGDGLGMNNSLPLDALGDTYVLPHNMSDYRIVTTEPDNTIIVSNSTGILFEHTSPSTTSFETPFAVEYGPQAGTQTGQETGPITVIGDKPFFLRTNHSTTQGEYSVIGWRQASANASSATGSIQAALEATAAASSATTAIAEATDAASQAAIATTERIAAESARDNAAGSASAASTSASSAATQAANAGNSATAASTSANTASTSAGNASVSEGNAATSETNAAGSATSAAASQALTANLYGDTIDAVNTITWSDYPNVETWSANSTGLPEDKNDLSVALDNDGGYSVVGSSHAVGPKHIFDAKRIYEVTVDVDITADPNGTVCRIQIAVYALDASGVAVDSNPWMILQDGANRGTGRRTYTQRVTALSSAPSGVFIHNDSALAEKISIRGGWRSGDSATEGTIHSLKIRDVTQEVYAEVEATAAATSASAAAVSAMSSQTFANTSSTQANNASTSAGQASVSATQSATAATNAADSESAAAASETAASGFSSAASTQATNASTSASQAGVSATQSAASATNAAGSATQASASALEAINASVGRNLLEDARILENTWSAGPFVTPTATAAYYEWSSNSVNNWAVEGFRTYAIQQLNTDSVGSNDAVSKRVAVEAGNYYEGSIDSGAHRCDAEIRMQWLDIDGNSLGYVRPASDAQSRNKSEAGGGLQLEDWKRIWVSAQAPASAAFCRLHLRKFATNAGQVNSYLFLSRPMIAVSKAGQTEAGEWTDGSNSATIENLYSVTATNTASAASLQQQVTTNLASAAITQTAVTNLENKIDAAVITVSASAGDANTASMTIGATKADGSLFNYVLFETDQLGFKAANGQGFTATGMGIYKDIPTIDVSSDGNWMLVQGVNFGSGSDLLYWYGPNVGSPDNCTRQNGNQVNTADGEIWQFGAKLGGTAVNTNKSISSQGTVTDTGIGSNGNIKTITATTTATAGRSYYIYGAGNATSGTTTYSSGSATVDGEYRIAGGTWSDVDNIGPATISGIVTSVIHEFDHEFDAYFVSETWTASISESQSILTNAVNNYEAKATGSRTKPSGFGNDNISVRIVTTEPG